MGEPFDESPRHLWVYPGGGLGGEEIVEFARAGVILVIRNLPADEVLDAVAECTNALCVRQTPTAQENFVALWQLFRRRPPVIINHASGRLEIGDWILFVPLPPRLRALGREGLSSDGLTVIKILGFAPHKRATPRSTA